MVKLLLCDTCGSMFVGLYGEDSVCGLFCNGKPVMKDIPEECDTCGVVRTNTPNYGLCCRDASCKRYVPELWDFRCRRCGRYVALCTCRV